MSKPVDPSILPQSGPSAPSVSRTQPAPNTTTIKGHTVVHSIPASQIKSKMSR